MTAQCNVSVSWFSLCLHVRSDVQELQAAEQQQAEAATAMDLARAVVESQRVAAHNGALDEDARAAQARSMAAFAHTEAQLRHAQQTHNQVCERQSRGAPAAAPFQARAKRFVQPAAAWDQADGDRLDLEPWCPDSFAVSSRATRPGAPSFAVCRTLVQEATAVPPLMAWTNEHQAHPVDLTAANVVVDCANAVDARHRLRASAGTQALTQAGFGAQTAARCASAQQCMRSCTPAAQRRPHLLRLAHQRRRPPRQCLHIKTTAMVTVAQV